MSSGPELPNDIMDAAQFIRKMRTKSYLSRQEKENLNRAKLKVAFWACRQENIVPSRDNLSYILGEDSRDIMTAFDKYLERGDEAAAREREKRKGGAKGGTQFWGGA